MNGKELTNAKKAAQARRRRRLKAYGRWVEPLVPADRARAHIEFLRGYGLSRAAVGQLAGMSEGMIEQISLPNHHQYRKRITRETEAKILAARFDLDKLDPDHQVDVMGTRRRLQALARMGYPRAMLAELAGYTTHGAFAHWMHPNYRYVTARNARRIRDLYDRLSMIPGPSPKAAAWAERNGWHYPLAWDDEDIDHPDARPVEGAEPKRRRKRRAA